MRSIRGEDLATLAAILDDQPYLMGDRPSSVDCTAYGFLAITLWAPIPYFGQRQLRSHANLIRYCERMRAEYWSEVAAPQFASPMLDSQPVATPAGA